MNHKAEISIGFRAAEFLINRFGTVAKMQKYGIERKAYYNWKEGATPSAYYLQLLCELGADPYYILTGRSNKK